LTTALKISPDLSPDPVFKTILKLSTFSPIARGFLNHGLVPSTRSSTRD